MGKTHSGGFDLERLRAGLKPFRLHWFARLRSTNDHAGVLRKRGTLFAPAVVLTGHQIAGRGRGNNTWWSGDGSIAVTFVFAADEHLAPQHVPLIAGLAVRTAVAEAAGNDGVQLKWPNDLLFNGKKLAGLLCERVYKADLVGLGLNVNIGKKDVPRGLRDRVMGLNEIAGQELDLTSVLILVGQHLRRMLANRDEQSFAAVIREYDRHHALVGKRVSVRGGADEAMVAGKCEGLDETGRLLVRERKVLHRVIAGHVEAI